MNRATITLRSLGATNHHASSASHVTPPWWNIMIVSHNMPWIVFLSRCGACASVNDWEQMVRTVGLKACCVTCGFKQEEREKTHKYVDSNQMLPHTPTTRRDGTKKTKNSQAYQLLVEESIYILWILMKRVRPHSHACLLLFKRAVTIFPTQPMISLLLELISQFIDDSCHILTQRHEDPCWGHNPLFSTLDRPCSVFTRFSSALVFTASSAENYPNFSKQRMPRILCMLFLLHMLNLYVHIDTLCTPRLLSGVLFQCSSIPVYALVVCLCKPALFETDTTVIHLSHTIRSVLASHLLLMTDFHPHLFVRNAPTQPGEWVFLW